MSTFTVIELDTTAPVVSWGAVGDAVASETFTVAYATNEPALKSATLALADGRVLALDVTDDALSCLLPDDAVEGWATLSALVRDDVGNEAARTLQIYVTGVIAPAPTGPPVLASPPQATVDRVASPVSRARAHAAYRVIATTAGLSTVRVRARYSSTLPRRLYSSSSLAADARWAVAYALPGDGSHAATRAADAVSRRPEGPTAEDDLLILGLL